MTTNMTIDYTYSSTRKTGDKLNTMDHFHKELQHAGCMIAKNTEVLRPVI